MNVWVKIPTAATAVVCSACIAVAAAPPAGDMAADHFAKTTSAGVKLAVNFENLDWLNAIPAYQEFLETGELSALGDLDLLNAIPAYVALLNGDPTALGDLDLLNAIPAYVALLNGDSAGLEGLDLLNGIPPYAEFLETGDLTVFARDEDLEGGVDLVSALPEFQALIEGDEAARTEALSRLDSVSAIPVYQAFGESGELSDLGGVDAFSAIPEIEAFGTGDTAARAAALRNLDAFSAIPEYLGIPEPEEEEPAPLSASVAALPGPSSTLSGPGVLTTGGSDPGAQKSPKLEATSTGSQQTKSNPEEGNSNNGSYSGSFKPEPLVLFGPGGSGGGADNGIRGWDKVVSGVKGALGLGPSEDSSADGGGTE
jgi:hypothetical protein